MADLLPPNSTALERDAAEALAHIERVPIPLRALCNPDECPVEFLPYLAWAFSVDRWSSNWPESAKREAIKSAYFIHAHKGTIGALRRVVEPLGYLLRVREWWQETPEGVPGTFKIDIGVLDSGITEETFDELNWLIDDAKPVTRHLVGLAINLEARGTLFFGASNSVGDELTVYPHSPEPINIYCIANIGFGQHIIDTVSVSHG